MKILKLNNPGFTCQHINKIIRILFISLFTLAISSQVQASFNHTTTLVPANFYKSASSNGQLIFSSLSPNLSVLSGASAKIKVIVPPGVEFFQLSMEVGSWDCFGSFGCLYGHSFSNLASPDDYSLAGSSAYSATFVNTTGALQSGTTASEQTGYFIIKNTSPSAWNLIKATLYMTVADKDSYNAWQATSAPSSSSTSSGGSGSGGSSSSTSSTSSSPSTSAPSSGGIAACGGFSGTPCPPSSSSTSSTSTSSSSSTSTSTSSSSSTSSGTTSSSSTSSGSSGLSSSSTSSSGSSTSAGNLSSLAAQLQQGIDALGIVGATYTEDDNYIFIQWESDFDFNDGSGTVDTVLKFRVNKSEWQAYVDSGGTVDAFFGANGKHTVNGFMLLTLIESSSTKSSNVNQLYLYPNVDDEAALIKTLEAFSNVLSASLPNHGVVYAVTDDNQVHRGVLNQNMIKLAAGKEAPSGTVIFDSVPDLNKDGYDDYSIIYDTGYKQYLYYLPPE